MKLNVPITIELERLKESLINFSHRMKEQNSTPRFIIDQQVLEQLRHCTAKLKFKNTDLFIDNLDKQLQKFSYHITQYFESVPLELTRYLESVNKRASAVDAMVLKIDTYPMQNIKSQLQRYAKVHDIEAHLPTEFINEINTGIKKFVVLGVTKFDELLLEKLCEKEVAKLNVAYFMKNEALQILNPNKYSDYVELVRKGISAFYYDLKAFVDSESEYFKLIEKYFLKIVSKMEALELQCNQQQVSYTLLTAPIETTAVNNPIETTTVEITSVEMTPIETTHLPTHIFKNVQAFNFFCVLAKGASNQEEIGFYYRQMSEKENPKQIVAKETVFRTWFNEESKQQIELKNPIKTFDRIKGIAQKTTIYHLTKGKL